VFPPKTYLDQDDTHRLIPTKYLEREESVLTRVADQQTDLDTLFEIDGITNERLAGESNELPGITVHELVFGVPHDRIINACFTHAQPDGSRFNGPDRGCWYAGFEFETARDEVAFHFAEELREIPAWNRPETRAYREYLADFRSEFHDIRGDDPAYRPYLDPDSYAASQRFARELLNAGSAGIVYPSVRHEGGTCIGCFRPALVTNVRQGSLVSITFDNLAHPPAVEVAHQL
jgi:hypothetical protein